MSYQSLGFIAFSAIAVLLYYLFGNFIGVGKGAFCHIPGVRIVTVYASQWATGGKHHSSYSGSVNCSQRLQRMYIALHFITPIRGRYGL